MNAPRGIGTMMIAVIATGSLWILGTSTLSEGQSLIHACVNKRTGVVRIVASGSACTPKEHPLSWPAEPGTEGSANVGQVDMVEDFLCPPSIDLTTVTNVPLQVSLSTGGGPVQLTILLNTSMAGDAIVKFIPVIDGVAHEEDFVYAAPGGSFGIITTTYARVYPLASGPHTFGLQAACRGEVTVFRAWNTAYELPLITAR